MALNFGPPILNFEPLGNLGKTFFDAQAAAQDRGIKQQRQQLLANLGQGNPDYNKVGLGLLATGDVQSGVALLGLGQKDKERQAEQEWFRNATGGGATQQQTSSGPAPVSNMGAGAPAFRGGGVKVANSEADVQRLEAEQEGLSQYGNPSQPRGLRNNNPGNIEAGNFAGRQAGYQGGDGRFAKFGTAEQGIQAADNLLQSYGQRGLNTVAGIVNRWAPPSENDTGAYTARVAKHLGVDPNQPIDMANPNVRRKLIEAKIAVENGFQPYGETVFARAYGGGAPTTQTAQAQQPVQMAQGSQVASDAPSQGAQAAQGFSVPGATPEQAQSIARDPAVQKWATLMATAPNEKTRTIAKGQMDLAIMDAKQRMAIQTPTDLQRNYAAAKREGYQGSFVEYQREASGRGTDKVPPGFEKTPDGQLRAIPGGPNDPAYVEQKKAAETRGAGGKPLAQNQLNDLAEKGKAVTDAFRFGSTFQDGYGGYKAAAIGNLANTAARNLGIGNEQGAAWWQDYDRYKNVTRNQLFGSALTRPEAEAFEKADINPGMTPQAIRKNLDIQRNLATQAAKKIAGALVAQGRNGEEIEAALGVSLDQIGLKGKGGGNTEQQNNQQQPNRTKSGVTWSVVP